MKTAIQICTQIKDCGGITKIENAYELRAGNAFMTSEDGEESWVHDKPESAPAPENTNCVGLPSTVVKEDNILRKHPKLRTQRTCGTDGYYHYNDKYAHLNSLIKDGIIHHVDMISCADCRAVLGRVRMKKSDV